ncbi:MAG: hypothetical protein PHO37_05730 [Kiritimatiellae bacterium]|nr:hypothetical protein [Kiritimatiellia bacterium]
MEWWKAAQQRFTKSSTGIPPVLSMEFTAETVEAVVTPELEGVYQWIWLNSGVVSAPAARVTNISWAIDYPGQPECDQSGQGVSPKKEWARGSALELVV